MVKVPKLGDDILEIDKEQSEAVNEIETDITNINEILNEIKDYPIEKGGDNNNNWVKWKSGKLVQRINVYYDTPAVTPYGSLFYNTDVIKAGNFKIPFIDTPYLTSSGLNTTAHAAQLSVQMRNNTITKNNGGEFFVYVAVTAQLNIKGVLSLTYEGKWK